MKKRILAVMLVLVLLFSITLTGCSSKAPKKTTEQVLKFNWREEPPDLDPQTTSDQISILIDNAVYEGLFRLDLNGAISPGLAESYEVSEDGKTYVFKLRNALWSDGTPITAEDFEYAWKRVLAPATASEYSYQLYHIENAVEYNSGDITDADKVGINALDEKTLEVKLVRPTPFFLSLTSFVTYMPAQKAAVEQYGDLFATDADKMVFSGPFIIKEWVHENNLVLEKNDKYWDKDAVKLDRIEGVMIVEDNTTVQMYENGELDMFDRLPAEFLSKYIDNPEYLTEAEATTWYLEYNCKDKYFSNYKMRLAFSLATDADTFVNKVQKGMGAVAKGLTPPNLTGKGHSFDQDRTSEMPGFDKDEAAKLFAEALAEIGATKEEFQKDVTIVAGEGDTWTRNAEFLQSQWKENLGVELPIEQMSFALRLDRYDTGTYQITYAGWSGDYNDPLTFMDMFVTDGPNNDAYWSNAAYDEAIKMAIEGTGDARIDAMVAAEAELVKELPIYPLYHPNKNIMIKGNVKDVGIYPVGSDFDFKWAYKE